MVENVTAVALSKREISDRAGEGGARKSADWRGTGTRDTQHHTVTGYRTGKNCGCHRRLGVRRD